MKRRTLIKTAGTLLTGSAMMAGEGGMFPERTGDGTERKLALTVAHITDVHLPGGDSTAAERFIKCLADIRKSRVDFFLNGGDSIMDASYQDVTREKMLQQWDAWDRAVETIKGDACYSCIGNHDPWWSAPDKGDAMYGKDYVVKRLRMPARYYSFSRNGWHFIVLDGNNKDISLDDTQYLWLEKELEQLPANTPTLLMSHFPVFGATPLLVGGNHSDNKKLKDLFYKHRDKVKVMLSGHNHLYDKTLYNGVLYCCNGAMSGFWWGKGDKDSAGPCYYLETPPGYAILKLYSYGWVENEYIAHGH